MHHSSNLSVPYLRLGDHICLFYRSQQELLATLVPYVRLGIELKEQCLCIQPPATNRKLLASLKAQGVDVGHLIRQGALVLLNPEQSYLDCGRFDPQAMKSVLAACTRKAMRKKFSGFRAAGDMRWALRKKPGCNRLLEYETLMDGFFPFKPAIGLCTYPVKDFSAAKLRDVLAVHHFALLEGHPTAKQRTLRIHKGRFLGDVTFDDSGNTPFHCRIQETSGANRLSWTNEKSLAAAVGSVKRQLRELRRTA